MGAAVIYRQEIYGQERLWVHSMNALLSLNQSTQCAHLNLQKESHKHKNQIFIHRL